MRTHETDKSDSECAQSYQRLVPGATLSCPVN
jgi:hypothetical protein